MTLVSPSQSNPGEEINASDINGPVNQLASTVNGNLDDTNIASLSGTKLVDGTVPAEKLEDSANVEVRGDATLPDHVVSGCQWTQSSGLNGTMTAGVVYVAAVRVELSTITSRAFTASKDTYVTVNSSGTVGYAEVANNATVPTLTSSEFCLARVVTDGSGITSITNYAQYQPWAVTISNVSGGTLNYAKYTRVGKRVHLTLKYTFAGAGLSGPFIFSTPSTMHGNYTSTADVMESDGVCFDSSASAMYFLKVARENDVACRAFVYNAAVNNAAAQNISSTVPMTWASGDFIRLTMSYEEA